MAYVGGHRLPRLVAAFAWLLVANISAPQAQEVHAPMCLYGCPLGTPATNDLIVRSIYALSSNDETKLADWVAYRVTKETIGPSKDRVWRADPELAPEETLEPGDYEGASAALGVDRGHQAPLASFSGTPEWAATNYLSNITPQKAALNQGAWERLESAERTLAKRGGVDAVYVLTGPIYSKTMPALLGADEPHRVPSAYWKIVAVRTAANRVLSASFIMQQDTPRRSAFCSHLTPIEEVERQTHLRFFPDLPKVDAGTIPRGRPLLAAELGCSEAGGR